MGFEVFLRCLEDDPTLGISRAAMRALFPVVEKESEADRWSVRYNHSNTCVVYLTGYTGQEEMIRFAMVERPCRNVRLWDAALAILKMGRVVFYSPGGPSAVASEAVRASLPAEEVAALGPVQLVQSGEEILRIIESS